MLRVRSTRYRRISGELSAPEEPLRAALAVRNRRIELKPKSILFALTHVESEADNASEKFTRTIVANAESVTGMRRRGNSYPVFSFVAYFLRVLRSARCKLMAAAGSTLKGVAWERLFYGSPSTSHQYRGRSTSPVLACVLSGVLTRRLVWLGVLFVFCQGNSRQPCQCDKKAKSDIYAALDQK